MAGSMMGMPLLVINMGGEMIYILEQRLRAQSIPAEKSEKVCAGAVFKSETATASFFFLVQAGKVENKKQLL